MERVIIHVDADCFEVQVWTKDDPDIQDKPIVVTNSSNVILTANYPAREFGISPKSYHHNLNEAFEKCPELINKVVPDRWGKADVRTLRLATYSFIDSLQKYRNEIETEIVVDFCGKEEFYLDVSNLVKKRLEMMSMDQRFPANSLTTKTIFEDTERREIFNNNSLNNLGRKDLGLLIGGMVANEIIEKLKLETGFQFSAGVAPNKLMATLACAKNKPAAVTILNEDGLSRLASEIKIEDIRNLGGKLGQEIKTELKIDNMEKLRMMPETFWAERFGTKKGALVHRLSWGIDYEEITEVPKKQHFKCSKNLLAKEGTRIIKDMQGLKEVLNDLAEELVEWLQEEKVRHNRRADLICVNLSRPVLSSTHHFQIPECGSFTCSEELTEEEIVTKSLDLLQKIWDKNQGMKPLQDLTEIRIAAKKLVVIGQYN